MQNVHPGLPSFDYVLPGSLAEASAFLVEHQDVARPFMGGTDIFVRMRDGFGDYKYLVDVKNLEGMDAIRYSPEGGLTLGAAVDMNQVIRSDIIREHYPLLVEAAGTVASYQLRSRATIAGNICNASPAGDTIGACLLLDASLQIHGIDGVRNEPLISFFLGPGKTKLEPGDILTAINFPTPPFGVAGRYIKLGRNQASDLAIVGVTAAGYPDSSKPSGFRIRLALASVAPVPLVVDGVEAYLSGEPVTEERIVEAARIAQEACSPISDVRSSARYREMMVRNLSQEALLFVWKTLNAAQ